MTDERTWWTVTRHEAGFQEGVFGRFPTEREANAVRDEFDDPTNVYVTETPSEPTEAERPKR